MTPINRRFAVVSTTLATTLLVLAADLTGGGTAAAQQPPAGTGATVPIVVVADGPLDASQVAAATGGAGRITGAIDQIGATVVEVPATAASSAIRRLDAVGGVTEVQRDGTVEAFDVTPNDPAWSYQDSMRSVHAPAAWSTSTGSPSVIIAVVDSGVDEVADLAGRVLPGIDYVNGDFDAADDVGHGTDSALVAAAAGNDASGAAGMCWTCKILPVKVLDSDGSGAMWDVARGIVWATDHGADVINLSLGGPGSDPAVAEALQYAFAHDVVVVASAGNDGTFQPNYPAANAGVVSVTGSTADTRTLYPWAQRGPDWVDVAAPGCNWVVDDGGLYRFCGTSSAAPLVAGIAGLLRAVRPSATREMVATAIDTTADWSPTVNLVGYGIVDAAQAVRAIPNVLPGPTPLPPDVLNPTVSMAPPSSKYVSGNVTVRVRAEDDQAVAVSLLQVDGGQRAYVDNPATVQDITLNTAGLSDGPHQLRAVARDKWGHEAVTGEVTINVDNTNPVGLLTNPSNGQKVSGPFVARVFTSDPSGIMGTFLIANDQVVGGYTGGGWGEATVPVTRSGTIRVVALTVDNAGHISGTNSAVVTASVRRGKARR